MTIYYKAAPKRIEGRWHVRVVCVKTHETEGVTNEKGQEWTMGWRWTKDEALSASERWADDANAFQSRGEEASK